MHSLAHNALMPLAIERLDARGWARRASVAARIRGLAIGRRLKGEQLTMARALGYGFCPGRNRAGLAAAMWHINRALGAYGVRYLRDGYDDELEPRDCIYSHIDLGRLPG